jgi:lysyl-tRNA synthetase class 2
MAWRPSATLATLKLRASLLADIRAFFVDRAVLEVETPALSVAGITDPALTSLTTRTLALGDTRLWLQTSPEFAMKRLLAAGSGDIYQICRVFRDGELGRWHQPEFAMLEWYRIGWNDRRLMREAGDLLASMIGRERSAPDRVELGYREAFERHLGTSADAGDADLVAALGERGIAAPAGLPRRGLLDLALSTVIVPALPRDVLTFIYDFPADQAALARLKPGQPPVAARFEIFYGGLELANGYWELTDATEQRARFEAELDQRRSMGLDIPAIDEALLAALAHGLPDCAGIAVGFDRLVAAALGLPSLDETMAFAHRLRPPG